MRKRRALVGLVVLGLVTVLLAGLAVLRSRAVQAVPTTPTTPTTPVTTQPTTQAPEPSASSAVPAPTATAAGGTLVVLGDGYAKGAAWVDQLGEELGMTVVNLSEDGMGYRVTPDDCASKPCRPFSGMAARVGQAKPDVVVVAGGDADGDYALSPFVESTFSALKKAVPDAEIVALSPLSARSPRPHWLTLHARSIETGAKSAGVTWVDVSAATSSASAYDGGHLSARAAAEVAGAVATSLK